MLLIVTATIIMGRFVLNTIAGKVALPLLLAVSIYVNVGPLLSYHKIYNKTKEVADYIKIHSTEKDFIVVAGFGNQYLHVMSDRLSPTKFIMPLFERNGYTDDYKRILSSDFAKHPPQFVVLNKNNYKNPDPTNFYTKMIIERLKSYIPVLENEQYLVYGTPSLNGRISQPYIR